ncbi:hypothetical protein FACS1894125_4800 [Actinomycetota bacterium]|nr:hypothetical protein FACS1894125_4800 [Actinomycetota bacterium]
MCNSEIRQVEVKQKWDIGSQNSGKELDWDPDSSPSAWKHYLKYTIPKLPDFIKSELLDEKFLERSDGYLRLPFVTNSVFGSMLGADTDFNFNQTTSKRKGKYNKHLSIVEDFLSKKRAPKGYTKDSILSLLSDCKNGHHTLENFSIMPVKTYHGMPSLNLYKGNKNVHDGHDRFDLYLKDIKEFYDAKSNIPVVCYNKKWFECFGDFYNYCSILYGIGSELANEIIAHAYNAPKIETIYNVISYCELAKKYWSARKISL